MRKLVIEEGGRHSTFEILQDRVVVGRDPEADLVVPNQRISRRHCEIRQVSSLLVVQDLGSSNGTLVNGEPVTIAELSPGDVISLAADVHLHVDHVAAEPAPVPGAGVAEPAARVERATNPRLPARRRGLPVGVVLAGIAVVAALVLMITSGRGDGEPEGTASGARAGSVAEGRRQLEAILAAEGTTPASETRRQLERLLETHRDGVLASAVRTELDAFLHRQRGGVGAVGAGAVDSRALFEDALRRGRFAEARGLLAGIEGGAALEVRLAGAMREASGDVEREAAAVAERLGPLAARDYLREHIARFPAASEPWRRLQDRAAAYGATAASARTPGPERVADATPDTSPEPARDVARGRTPDAEEVAVKSADQPPRKASIDHLMEQARRSRGLVDDGNYAEARPILEEVHRNAQSLGHRAVADEAERNLRFCRLQDVLVQCLVEAARAPGARLGRVASPSGGTVALQAVDADGLSVVGEGGVDRLAWRVVPVATIAQLARRLPVVPDGQLGAAALLLRAGRVEDGEALLAQAYRKDGELKPRIDRVLADAREMPLPPEGFVLQDDRWLSPAQVERARLNNDISALLASLASDDFAERELAFERLTSLGEAARSTLHRELLRARSATLARIRSHGSFARVAKIREAYLELEKRRQHALELIFDVQRFPYPYRPPEASAEAALAYRTNLPEVHRRINEVYEVWRKNAGAAIPTMVREELGRVRHVDALLLRGEFGELPESEHDWLLWLPEDERVTVQSFARDPEERRRIDLSEKIRALNRSDPAGAKVGERKQVEITNDYRMMMGRWALRIHAPLVRASRGHCQDMARLGFFAHDSPVPGKHTPGERVARENVAPLGMSENIARSRGPQEAHSGWLDSPGHHRNILGPAWRLMGPGNSGNFWCQVFCAGDVNAPFDPEAIGSTGK